MRWGPVVMVAVVLAALLPAPAPAQISMTQSVIGSGGGESFGAAHRVLGTVGQAAIGVVTGAANIHEIGFWYQPGWILTSVPESPAEARYFLGQSFPNPFNPITTLEFGVAERSRVNLTLYNVAGKEVRTLVDQDYEPGTYRTVLDAAGLSSGVYFCRMTAGDFTAKTRLVLLK